jgi:hypothetical protein
LPPIPNPLATVPINSHISGAQSNTLFPIGYATGKTISFIDRLVKDFGLF